MYVAETRRLLPCHLEESITFCVEGRYRLSTIRL